MRTSLDTSGTQQPHILWSPAEAHPMGDDRIELGQWSRHQQHIARWTIMAFLVAGMILLGSAWRHFGGSF